MAVDLTIAWGAEELYEMHGEQGFFFMWDVAVHTGQN